MRNMQSILKAVKTTLSLAIIGAALTGCDTTEWPGPGSDLTKTPQDGGDINANGAHFGSWVNNAYGINSTIMPVHKDHPPLQGAEICAIEYANLDCAVTGADGRFEFYGIPTDSPVHLSIAIEGYYSLLIPYEPTDGDFTDQPALEIPSMALQDVLDQQLSMTSSLSNGSMSFMIIDGPNLSADPEAVDHDEINGLVAGAAIRYRRVFTDEFGVETFGDWSNPSSWILSGGDVVYLNGDESPDTGALMTSGSGLGLALNLAPGTYEVEADDTNYDGGFGTLLTGHHYDCYPIHTMPRGSAEHIARTEVVAGHLSDVRMFCE